MKKLIINGRYYSRAMTGVERFATETVAAFDEFLSAHPFPYKVVLAIPPDVDRNLLSFKNIEIEQFGRLKGAMWEQIELGYYSRGDLLLNLCNSAPLLKMKQIVVIHDAGPASVPESYSWKFRYWYKFLMPFLGLISRHVITVSNFSADDIAKQYHIDRSKISVVSESGEHITKVIADDSIIDHHQLKLRPFALAVSSRNPHKNFATLVKAVESLGANFPFDLVIAGGANPKVFASAPLPDFVKHVGYVSDECLKSLYQHAACFIFPSYYEGFGLPAAEAMAVGCPVIASDAASIPEVCNEAAVYFPCRDHVALGECLAQALGDPQLLADLKTKGLQRSTELTWAKTANQLAAIIQHLNA